MDIEAVSPKCNPVRFGSCPELPIKPREHVKPFYDATESCQNLASKGETTPRATYDDDSLPPLFSLPPDIIKIIAKKLPPLDFLNFMLSCKHIRSICCQNVVSHIKVHRIFVSPKGIFIIHRSKKPNYSTHACTFGSHTRAPLRRFIQSPFRLICNDILFEGEVTDSFLEAAMARVPRRRVSFNKACFSPFVTGYKASAEVFGRFLEHFSITELFFGSPSPVPADYFIQMQNIVCLKFNGKAQMTEAHLLEMKNLRCFAPPNHFISTVDGVNLLLKQFLQGERDIKALVVCMRGFTVQGIEGLVKGCGPLQDAGRDLGLAESFFARGASVVRYKYFLLIARGEERVAFLLTPNYQTFFNVKHQPPIFKLLGIDIDADSDDEDSESEDDVIHFRLKICGIWCKRLENWFSGCFTWVDRRRRHMRRGNLRRASTTSSISTLDSSFSADSAQSIVDVVDQPPLAHSAFSIDSISASLDPAKPEEPQKKTPGCFHWIRRFFPRRTSSRRPTSPDPHDVEDTVD